MFNIKNLKIKENYIPFTEYQLAVLDMQQYNGGKTKKIQSVLRYVMLYSPNGKLVYSRNRLYSMYTYKDKRISQKYFYNLIKELIDLNLLEQKGGEIYLVLTKKEQTGENTYTDNEKVQKKVQEKVQTKNVAETLETSASTEYSIPTLKTSRVNNNYNIYNTTSNELCPSQNSNIYASLEDLKSIAEDLYKNLKIRSRHIKTDVLNMIYQYEGKISIKGARQYLKAVILDKKVARDKEREEFAKKYIFAKNIARVNHPVTGDTFGNYTSNNRKRLAQMEARRQYLNMEEQFENIGTDWQNYDWCM